MVTIAPTIGLNNLLTHYRIQGYQEVCDFLQRYPHLVPLLLEAEDKITAIFGATRPCLLELTYDPEGVPESAELFVLVPTRDTPEVALEKLAQLDREWWCATSRQAHGKMNIDLEYV